MRVYPSRWGPQADAAAGQDLEAGVLKQDLWPVLLTDAAEMDHQLETPCGMGAELTNPGSGGKGHLGRPSKQYWTSKRLPSVLVTQSSVESLMSSA